MNFMFLELSIQLTHFWIRVFGYGFWFGYSEPLFSERSGSKKPLFKIGKFRIKLLKPVR